MKKSLLVVLSLFVLVVSSFAFGSFGQRGPATQPGQRGTLQPPQAVQFQARQQLQVIDRSQFVLGTKDISVSGTVKEVVLARRGDSYITLTTDKGEKQIPAGLVLRVVAPDVGSKLTLSGKEYTVFVPTSISSNGYKANISTIPSDSKAEKLSLKVSKIDATKRTVTLVDSKNKSYTLPLSVLPNLANAKIGAEVVIEGYTTTLEHYTTLNYDGKAYTINEETPRFLSKDGGLGFRTRMAGRQPVNRMGRMGFGFKN